MLGNFEFYYLKFLFIIDKIFIIPYKFFYFIFKNPVWAYFLGTFILSFTALLIGKLLLGFVFYINRSYIKSLNEELIKWYNLSVEALEKKDSEKFHLFNKEANEYFGKLFFLNIAQSISLLVILPFILAWLQFRFGEIKFPLPVSIPFIGSQANYIFVFLICYLLAWLFYKQIYRFLPIYRKIEKFIVICGDVQKEMKSMAEVLKKKIEASKIK
ncbi:hypothetical protein [Thermodesulfobacterium hydrogeniphilum]|uniref:hypothetical protein n=1 Tax=Thermodesulfobacterium hydrogeniphilum TaxID=161156 RepID=UPI000570AED4|nr:hypothetical protein [Thermodesulfobacterium hydrogeniphilum]